MNNILRSVNEEYQLLLLTKQHIETLYNWNIEEKHFEQYSCRPLRMSQSFEKYSCKTLKSISEGKQKIYVLVNKKNPNIPLGKITLFDLNSRNHSAEFGYYFPDNNRSQGLGSIMLTQFIKKSFKDDKLNLNKIYATTSSNNIPSIKLLEKFNFKLDGRLREHYWINENKYDQLIYSKLKCEWTN
ncbi:GNAT family N-acetyltransferase [Haloimpatiens sp. FM7330]|uniref:GNAT family N-acetyltransferase n=1 Tax=Haloimpatiens sp. FM7330 TaxID=3298610 RepID=UPI003634B6E2